MANKVCLVIAVVLLVFAGFGFAPISGVSLGWIGLASGFLSFLL